MRLRFRPALFVYLAFVVIVGLALILKRAAPPTTKPPVLSESTMRKLAAELTALDAKESEIAGRVWGTELLAEQCGAVIESLWDTLNFTSNKFEVLRAFPIRQLSLPIWSPGQVGHGIDLFEPSISQLASRSGNWLKILDQAQVEGWSLVQMEFRHNSFETNKLGKPSRSVFYSRSDWSQPVQNRRATLEGDVQIDWAPEPSAEGFPVIEHVDASHLHLLTRTGEPPFRLVLDEEVRPVAKSHFIDPLILYDLDGDGISEIILAAKNLVFQRQTNGTYIQRPLCRYPPSLVFTGVIADFDGDGIADFLCAVYEGLILFKGSSAGTFDEPGRLVWKADPHLKYAQVLTCGDIDHDGDLDLWLGQYKNPYERGQMPTPYYDANDGNPSFLLLNDGHGNFSEATASSGLGPKRWRRCYSASFVDLQNKGNLDLLVVSDFAGVDVFANDGKGHFTDRTQSWLPERHMFGMGHAFADFNLDGHLDCLVMGMNCPTAQRLDHLSLQRPNQLNYDAMRPLMTFGNRLFLGQPEGNFRAGPLGETIRRSGWSWGCTAFDWDNDGFPDVYVVNGHETRQTVKDYESEFWLHDIYVGNSQDDIVKNAYFGSKIARTRGHGQSYGGYEKNRLFMNRRGESFLEAGYLLGIAVEEDSRNLVADDLDGDGRVDLIFTTFETWPKPRQTIRVYQNHLPDSGNWIGFHLIEREGTSAVGTTVTLGYAEKTTHHQIVTGDSHRSQHASTLHFGIGQNSKVDSAEIRWQNGRQLRLENPAINRYYRVIPPL